MNRPVVLHVASGWSECGTSIGLVASLTATRAVVALPSGSVELPSGPAPDLFALRYDATTPADLRRWVVRQAVRRHVALIHAHDAGVAAAVTAAARMLRRPVLVTLDESEVEAVDVGVAALAAVVIAPSAYAVRRLVERGVPPETVRLVRPGVRLEHAEPLDPADSTTLVVSDDFEVPAQRYRSLRMQLSGRAVFSEHPALIELTAPAGAVSPRLHVVLNHEAGARAAQLDAIYHALAQRRAAPGDVPIRVTVPEVSVVVPTYNRRALVERTIAALQAQTFPAESMEVVVVDDHSTDGTDGSLAGLSTPWRLTVAKPAEKRFAANARNRGVAVATGEIVAFTDDDCRPEPTWLEAMVAGFDAGIDLVQGRTVADPEQPRSRWSRTISTPVEYGLYETANIAYRRATLVASGDGPFDPSLPEELRRIIGRRLGTPGTGEDSDLAWRVRRSGGGSRFASHATVRHEIFDGTAGATLRDAVRAAGFAPLVRRAPELRTAFFWHRYFLRSSHAALLLAMAAIVGAFWEPWVALLVVPYAWGVLRPTVPGLRSRIKWAPFAVLRDCVELAGCCIGSVAARRLVL